MPDYSGDQGAAGGSVSRSVKYSFVVPILRDEALADDFCAAFEQAMSAHLGEPAAADNIELIFVHDGGTEDASHVLRGICDHYPFAKLVTLTRNFGQHIALSCGYRHASGEYVGMLNVDQEDPPDQIPRLLTELDKGEADIVYSLHHGRRGSALRKLSSRLFNWVLNKATGDDVPLEVGTLRVMNRAAVDSLNALPERGRFLPGLEMWLGFRRAYVETVHEPRTRGRSSYTTRGRLRMAFEAIISFSDLPLRIAAMFGALIAFVGFALGAFLVLDKLFSTDYRPGYTSTMAAIVFMGGIQICVIGLASLYIGRILTESQRRPLYVVRDRYKIAAMFSAE